MSQFTFILKIFFVIICTMCIEVLCLPRDHIGHHLNQPNSPARRDPKSDAGNALRGIGLLGHYKDGDEDEPSSSVQNKPPSSGNAPSRQRQGDEDNFLPKPKKPVANRALSPALAKSMSLPFEMGSVAGASSTTSNDSRFPHTGALPSETASSKNSRNATAQSGTRRMSTNAMLQNTESNDVVSSSAENKMKHGDEKTQKSPKKEATSKMKSEVKEERHDNDLGNKNEEKNETGVIRNKESSKSRFHNKTKETEIGEKIRKLQRQKKKKNKKNKRRERNQNHVHHKKTETEKRERSHEEEMNVAPGAVAGAPPTSNDSRFPQTGTLPLNMASSKNSRNATGQSGTRQMSANTTLQNTRPNNVTSSSAENKATHGVEKTQKGPKKEVASETNSKHEKETHDNDLGNKNEEKNNTGVMLNGKTKEFGNSRKSIHREGEKEQENDRVNEGTKAAQSGLNKASRNMVHSGVLPRSLPGFNVTSLTKSRNVSLPAQPRSTENDRKMEAANKKPHDAGKDDEKMHKNPKNEADIEKAKPHDTANEALKAQKGEVEKKKTSKPKPGQENPLDNKKKKSNQGSRDGSQNKGLEKDEDMIKEKPSNEEGEKKEKADGRQNRGKKERKTVKHQKEGERKEDKDNDEDKNKEKSKDSRSTTRQGKEEKEQEAGGPKKLTDTKKQKNDQDLAAEKDKLKRKNYPIGDSMQKAKEEKDIDKEDKMPLDQRQKPNTGRNRLQLPENGAIVRKTPKENFSPSELDQYDSNNKKPKTKGGKEFEGPSKYINLEKKPSQRRSSHFSRGGTETDGATGSSHFIVYGTVGLILLIVLYVVYQKRQKILALIVEGRRRGASGSGERSRRGSGNVAYRPLPTKETDDAASRPESLQKYIY